MSETKDIPLTKQLNIPPLWLIGMLLLMWFWSSVLPIVKFGGAWTKVPGALLIVASMALAIWSVMQFQGADTPVHPRRKPTTLLTEGVYARSRNPIYLAMLGVALGAALCFGTLGALIPVAALFWILQDMFIKGEEHHIEKTFGDEWRAYAAKTRRWL
jgi:protein-S-isoprenylcysteine O-methyltransferase Ste14